MLCNLGSTVNLINKMENAFEAGIKVSLLLSLVCFKCLIVAGNFFLWVFNRGNS